MRINQALNDKELNQLLKEPLKYAVRILMEKILELNEDSINKVVYYNKMGTPECYVNTYQFIDAWDIAVHSSKAIKTSDIQGNFFYRPNWRYKAPEDDIRFVPHKRGGMLSYEPSEENNYMGQHHGIDADSGKGKWKDSRPYLAEILYEGIQGNKIFGDGPWTKERNAFKDLVKVIGTSRFKKMMSDSLREAGLRIKVHNCGIPRKEF